MGRPRCYINLLHRTHTYVIASFSGCAGEKASIQSGNEVVSFPGSSALEHSIELVHVERAWYFFSCENPQR